MRCNGCLQTTTSSVGVAHTAPRDRTKPGTSHRHGARKRKTETRMRRTAHVHARADGSHTQCGEPTAHTHYQQDAQSQASTGHRVYGMRSQLRLAPVSHLSTSNPMEHPKEPSSVERITMLCGGARPCTPALPLMRRVPHTATHAPLPNPPPLPGRFPRVRPWGGLRAVGGGHRCQPAAAASCIQASLLGAW